MANGKLPNQIPQGVRDLLPEEAFLKREMETRFSKLFQRWGYQEVVTPTFEHYESLIKGSNWGLEEKLFKFLDRQGQILALRPDMTAPIARFTATRLKESMLPLRLFYLANVFGYIDPQAGRQREYYQAGVELIGSPQGVADAEVIALAVETLKAAGIKNFQLSLGQMDVFNGLMEELKLPEEEIIIVKNLISNKDFVGLEEHLQGQPLSSQDRERLICLTTLHGGPEVIEEARQLIGNPKGALALDNLAQVYQLLEFYGVADKVAMDLGLLRGFDYYTGIVFEGYTTALGFPICGGGRYDKLLGQFGHECPATGFALGIERVLLALSRQGNWQEPDSPDFFLVFPGNRRGEALAKARELREQGKIVETEVVQRSLQESLAYAKSRGCKEILIYRADGQITPAQ